MRLYSESMASAQLQLKFVPKDRGSVFFGTILINQPAWKKQLITVNMPKDFSAQITSVRYCCYSVALVYFIAVYKVERKLSMLTVPV